jgi:hypothetical protein
MTSPPAPTRKETLETIVQSAKRGAVPIRSTFVQQRDVAGQPAPGPLQVFAHRGRFSALLQYLLARTWASGGEYELTYHPSVWIRAMGLPEDDSGRRTLRRNWELLRTLRLVATRRSGRLLTVTLLREDGSGEPYEHPGKAGNYFKLPHQFWLEGYDERLSLPETTLLLISLTLGDWFWMPQERGAAWYGLSVSTMQRGLRGLVARGVLKREKHYKPAPLAPAGYTEQLHYCLQSPFGPKGTLAKTAPAAMRSAADLVAP